MKNKLLEKYKYNMLIIMDKLILFDLWLLIKTRKSLRVFLMLPTIKLFLYIFLAGLFLNFIFFINALSYVDYDGEFFYKNKFPSSSKFLEIDDKSKASIATLNQELIRIKVESIRLKTSLHRMNLRFKNLNEYQRNTDANLPDFASEAVGGIVIDTPNTRSYHDPKSTGWTLFGIPIWKPNYYTPRKIIQPWTEAGECWAFLGSRGKIEIELAHAVIIDSVTLEHVSASATLTGKIHSAPKSFNVLGKIKNEYVSIDVFMYKDTGKSSQTFKITNRDTKDIPFRRVMLEILSNWGNMNYTCIYRFKVHGKIYDYSNDDANLNVQ